MRGKILALLLAAALILSGCAGAPKAKEQKLTVVASFYPVWVMTANVIQDVEGVELSLLAPPDTGCLHHYQLLPQDMKTLEGADVLVMNGAGMEHFLEGTLSSFPELKAVDTSSGLDLIEEAQEGGVNPHVWLDVDNAMAQTRAIAAALKEAMPQQAAAFEANAQAYCQRLESVKEKMQTMLEPVKGQSMVTSHDAFAYLAQAFGLEVAAVIQQDEETDPSAAEIGRICNLMDRKGINTVFIEPDTTGSAPEAIAGETGAKLVTLDPMTTGELDAAAYERIQLANAQAIFEALQ